MDWSRSSKRILLCAALFLISFAGDAQDSTSVAKESVSEKNNTGTSQDDIWTDAEWEELRKKIDYEKEIEEKEEEQEEESSDPSAFWAWLKDLLQSKAFRIVVIALVAGILFWLVLRILMRRDDSAKKASGILVLDENPEELPAESDLEKLLRLALESSDRKSAVRILYLIALQRLNEKKYIIWKKNKTNRDYQIEIRQQHFYAGFQEITLLFEIVWYGDVVINQDEYRVISERFSHFNEHLNGR